MNDRDLKTLLERIDLPPAGAAPPAGQVAAQARRIHGRRRMRNLAAGSVVAGLLAACVLVWQRPSVTNERASAIVAQNQPDESPDTVESMRAELAALQIRVAELHRQMDRVAAIRSLELDPGAIAAARAAAEVDVIRFEQEARLAVAMLTVARFHRDEPSPRSAAQHWYGRVIEQFPNTRWSQQASQELACCDM